MSYPELANSREGAQMPGLEAPQAWDPGRPLTLEAFHSLPAHALVPEADERFLDGVLEPERPGCGLGSMGSAGPPSPTRLPTLVYCTRLAMAFPSAPLPVWSSLGVQRGAWSCLFGPSAPPQAAAWWSEQGSPLLGN